MITDTSKIAKNQIITKIKASVSRLKIKVADKNTPRNPIIAMIIQFAKALEKNSKLSTSGEMAISTPIRTSIDDIPGIINCNSFIVMYSNVQPIKNTVKPIAIIEEIA